MIISERVSILITPRNVSRYNKIGYKSKIGEYLDVNISDLNQESKTPILVKCDVCGKEKSLAYNKYIKNISKYNIYTCSAKCSSIKNKMTCNDRYGVDHPLKSDIIKERVKNTVNQKYGVDNIFQNFKIKDQIKESNIINNGVEYPQQNNNILEKSNNTNLQKYGFKRPAQSKEIRDKIQQTNLNKYGVFVPTQSNEIINKIIDNNIIKYGVSNTSKLDIVKYKIIEKSLIRNKKTYLLNHNLNIISYNDQVYDILCNNCGKPFHINKKLLSNRIHTGSTICTKCNPYNSLSSDKENQLLNFIKENYDGIIIENDRTSIGLELDIYLPELGIAFEFNGLYWHSEVFKENNYHKNKSDLCDKVGIQLLHIWEDDWFYKKDIIKSILLNKIGKSCDKIYARKCLVKEIVDTKLVTKFLNDNHIQGFAGSSVKLGLFYSDKLVSLMTFGKPRKNMNSITTNENDYELIRFCNKLNTNVIGGASKLFNYFLNNYKPIKIVSYADRSYSNGNLYKQLGFELNYITNPNYYYIEGGLRTYRFKNRKDVLIKMGFDQNKSEHDIMLERKIYRIYNSGNYKFTYII